MEGAGWGKGREAEGGSESELHSAVYNLWCPCQNDANDCQWSKKLLSWLQGGARLQYSRKHAYHV